MMRGMSFAALLAALWFPVASHGEETAQTGKPIQPEMNPVALLSSDQPNRLG